MATGTSTTTQTSARTTSTGATSTAAAGSSRTTIAQNFDSFLTLLTTQLKNQSPLDPLDTNQFTQQLVQFASVEQQLKSNETLTALLTSSRASTTSTAASFVGLTVTAAGATTKLQGGKAEWTLDAARDAAKALITIKDASGATVATRSMPLKAGTQTFTWDGRGEAGLLPDGNYTISVAAADATSKAVTVKTDLSGRVDAVDMAGDEPVLVIGNARVPLASLKSIKRTDG